MVAILDWPFESVAQSSGEPPLRLREIIPRFERRLYGQEEGKNKKLSVGRGDGFLPQQGSPQQLDS